VTCSAGRPKLTIQGLRHTHAAAAREAGIEIGIISKNMGHANVAITEDIYANITSSVMEDVAQKIVSKLFGK
jgi:integrase